MRRITAAAALTLLVLGLTFAAAGTALAGSADSSGMQPVEPGERTIALANTGLNITVPVIVGLSVLVLGIAFVSWAFLRGGSARHHH